MCRTTEQWRGARTLHKPDWKKELANATRLEERSPPYHTATVQLAWYCLALSNLNGEEKKHRLSNTFVRSVSTLRSCSLNDYQCTVLLINSSVVARIRILSEKAVGNKFLVAPGGAFPSAAFFCVLDCFSSLSTVNFLNSSHWESLIVL